MPPRGPHRRPKLRRQGWWGLQELRFSAEELASASRVVRKALVLADGCRYTLNFEALNASQTSWRLCNKCNSMFFDDFPTEGKCPGVGHQAQGLNFVLPHDIRASAHERGAWRFCGRFCGEVQLDVLRWVPNKGVYRTGGGHAAGFNFVPLHE